MTALLADVAAKNIEASGWRQGFAIDARGLAVTRILTGTWLLWYFIDRFRDLAAHYTDAGALPREVAKQVLANSALPPADALQDMSGYFTGASLPSLNMLSGGWGLQAVLATCAIMAAIGLLVGFKARWSALIGWLLCLSFEGRNYLLNYPGDPVMRMLLLWLALLPANRWGIDAQGHEKRTVSPVSMAYTIYFAYFLLLVGLRKTGQSWLDGTAIHYVLGNRSFASGLGDWLLETPRLTMALTHLTMAVEILCPLAILALARSARARLLAVVMVLGLMVSIQLTMRVYLLPLLVAGAYVALLPGFVWDAVEARVGRWRKYGERAIKPGATRSSPKERSVAGLAVALLVISMTVDTGRAAAISYDFAYLQPPRPLVFVADLLQISSWSVMFRNPAVMPDGWSVIPGDTREGRRVDLLTGEPPTFAEPTDVRPMSFRWWRFLRSTIILRKSDDPLSQVVLDAYANSLCQSWNERHSGGEQLMGLEVIGMVMRAPKPGERAQPPTRRSHGTFSCAALSTP